MHQYFIKHHSFFTGEITGEIIPSVEDIEKKYSKKEMQEWLAKRNLPKSGNKKLLARRIHRHLCSNESDSEDDDDDAIDDICKSHYLPSLDANWSTVDAPDQIPPVSDADVTNYYLYTKNPLTGVKKNCARYLKKGKKYSVQSNYIDKISVVSEGNLVSFKARIRPSMKSGTYITTVTLIYETGMVAGGSCTCKVGSDQLVFVLMLQGLH